MTTRVPSILLLAVGAVLVLSVGPTTTTTTAIAQYIESGGQSQPMQLQWQQQPPEIERIAQIDEDGYRIGVINGWVAQQWYASHPGVQQAEKDLGTMYLFMQCREDKFIPQIGGGHSDNCLDAVDGYVLLTRFIDLELRPEFADVLLEQQQLQQQQNYNITTSDFLAFFLQFSIQLAVTATNDTSIKLEDVRLLENIDVPPVNVTDPQTNQIIAQAPARFVEISEEPTAAGGLLGAMSEPQRIPFFLVLDDTKTTTTTTTGYALVTFNSDLEPELRQIFNSFELLAAEEEGAQGE